MVKEGRKHSVSILYIHFRNLYRLRRQTDCRLIAFTFIHLVHWDLHDSGRLIPLAGRKWTRAMLVRCSHMHASIDGHFHVVEKQIHCFWNLFKREKQEIPMSTPIGCVSKTISETCRRSPFLDLRSLLSTTEHEHFALPLFETQDLELLRDLRSETKSQDLIFTKCSGLVVR